MTFPRTKNVLVPAVVLALAALSACSPSAPQAREPAPTPTETVTGTPSAPAGTATSMPTGAPTTAAPTTAPTSVPITTAPAPPATAPPATGPQPCPTADLTVTEGGGSGGAAGSVYTAVRFVNKGAAACTLSGHPGVSYVGGADGHQVGKAADRGSEEPLSRVLLQPGGEAHATLRITQEGVYPPGTCVSEPVRGLRVYPPDQTASAFVPFQDAGGTACSKDAAPQLTVEPVVAGPPTR